MDSEVNPNEGIKARSHLLRGTLRESIADPLSGGLSMSKRLSLYSCMLAWYEAGGGR